LIGILGPTASGKSVVAESLADEFSAQLINADAFQVYMGFDIGTSKSKSKERYKGIDLIEPSEQFGVVQWIQYVIPILEECLKKCQSAIIVGGTGLYVRALFEEFSDMSSEPDPLLREQLQDELRTHGLDSLVSELMSLSPENRVDMANPIRVTRALEKLKSVRTFKFSLPPFQKQKFALLPSVVATDSSIGLRLRAMMNEGFVEEVRRLVEKGVPKEAPAFRAIGYRTILRLLDGEVNGDEALSGIETETRRYAKRQRTWIRSEPNVHILEAETPAEFLSAIRMRLSANGGV
jgi:tRNA dimethylallyltransferase